MSGLRDKILSFDDIEHRQIEVPEWGGLVIELRTPTVLTRGELVGQFMRADQTVDYVSMYPALLIACAYDPDTGEKLFTNDDMAALTGKSAKALEKLSTICMELAGMDGAAVEAGKDDSSTSTPIPKPPTRSR